MAMANLNKSEELVTNTTAASKYMPKRPRICINGNLPFQTLLHKIFKNYFLWSKSYFTTLIFRGKLLISKFWSERGDFKMQILGLLGMYFDASEGFVINFSLLFRLGILCCICSNISPGPFLLCTFIIHEKFWLKRENIFSHPFHILRAYFLRSWFLNFFPTLLKSCIDYVWFQMGRH